MLQYYASALSIPSLIVVQGELAEGSELGVLGEILAERRGGAGRDPRLRARRQAPHPRARRAQRAARARPGEAQGRAPPPAARGLARRPAEGARPGRAAGAHRVLRHLAPRRHAHRRVDGRLRGRRAEEDRLPTVHDPRGRARRRFRARWRRCSPRRYAQWERQNERSPVRRRPRRVVRRAAEPGRDRRRQGPARAPAWSRCRASASAASTVVSLAKRIEEVFLPGVAEPIVLPHDTPELQLLQRVRDEAHRFAITHHRIRRDKAMTESIMDELPGIGPGAQARAAQALRLARRRCSAPRARSSRACPGFPQKVARDLYAHLNKTGR